MQRVAILGSGGSGKTTVAAAIAARTGLPVVHLDVIFWRPGWRRAPAAEAARELRSVIAGERWILDGNFLGLAAGAEDGRLERADAVVFLDRPRLLCLWRALTRLVRSRGARRPDLPPGCRESLDVAFLRWIWRYPHEDRPRILARLARLDLQAGVAVHHLRSNDDVRWFLAAL